MTGGGGLETGSLRKQCQGAQVMGPPIDAMRPDRGASDAAARGPRERPLAAGWMSSEVCAGRLRAEVSNNEMANNDGEWNADGLLRLWTTSEAARSGLQQVGGPVAASLRPSRSSGGPNGRPGPTLLSSRRNLPASARVRSGARVIIGAGL